MKLNELEENDRRSIEDELWAKSSNISSENFVSVNPLSKFGICGKCSYFEFAESEFNVEHAKCENFQRPVSERRPIRNCTGFNEKGSMSLRDMQNIAYLIDPPKDKVGFCG